MQSGWPVDCCQTQHALDVPGDHRRSLHVCVSLVHRRQLSLAAAYLSVTLGGDPRLGDGGCTLIPAITSIPSFGLLTGVYSHSTRLCTQLEHGCSRSHRRFFWRHGRHERRGRWALDDVAGGILMGVDKFAESKNAAEDAQCKAADIRVEAKKGLVSSSALPAAELPDRELNPRI